MRFVRRRYNCITHGSWLRWQLWLLVILLGSTAPEVYCAPTAIPEFDERYLLVLEAQVDALALSRDLGKQKFALEDRHEIVVNELQRTAKATQPAVITELQRLKNLGKVYGYRAFTIRNVIAVRCAAGMRDMLEMIPGVASVDADLPLEYDGEVEPRLAVGREGSDPLDAASEGLLAIRARMAWAFGINGTGVIVANLDSGVEHDHPALAGKWRGDLGVPPEYCWKDLSEPITSEPDGYASHGSMTMGIICGAEAGDTIGVAWGAKYIAAQITFDLSWTSDALEIFDWFVDPDGNPGTFDDVPRVISNSWGIAAAGSPDPCNNAFYAAIDNCEAAGAAVVWAAGNSGPSYGTVRIPANRADAPFNSFAVGGFDHNSGGLYAYSSRGPTPCTTDSDLMIKPEVVAPAVGIRSSGLNSGYYIDSGTSYAAPHVAGTIALMVDANSSLDPDSLKELIALTAVDAGDNGNDNLFGYGKLDAFTAVYAAITGIGWLKGYITNEIGDPVQAEIYLPEHPHSFRSDASGFFCFPFPAWLNFDVEVVVPGHEVFTATWSTSPGDTTIEDIDLVHSDNGTLTGTVIDCEGAPAAGALVQIIDGGVGPDITDVSGRFLFSLEGGFYDVFASSASCGNVTEPDVQVVTGGVTEIEIVLPLNPNFACSDEDSDGYKICDDNDETGPTYQWTAIAPEEGGTGQVLNIADDGAQEVLLPFPFYYHNISYSTVFINANGNLSFGDDLRNYVNLPLPTGLGAAVYGYWDDLDDGLADGSVVAQYRPDRGVFIVEWFQVPRLQPTGQDRGSATFQFAIWNPALYLSGNGNSVLDVYFGELDSTGSCTVGMEDTQSGNFVKYLFNGDYEPHASPLVNGRALRFADEDAAVLSPQLVVDTPALTVLLNPGEAVDTVITIRNTGSDPLSYSLELLTQDLDPIASGTSAEGPPARSQSLPKDQQTDRETQKGASIRSGSSGTLDAGAPDAYGYGWIDSRDAGGPVHEFFDISGIGTLLPPLVDDGASIAVDLPWEFPFYSRKFTRLIMHDNGLASFWSVYNNPNNFGLDAYFSTYPFYIVAPLWMDFDPVGGEMYVYNDAAENRFIVQWENYERWGQSGSDSDFQLILYCDGTIEFVYGALNFSTFSATVGMKGGGGGEYKQLSYQSSFIVSNLTVRIYREMNYSASCEILDNSLGVLGPGEVRNIPIAMENGSLDSGWVSWSYVLRSTDPVLPSVNIETQLVAASSSDLDLVVMPGDSELKLYWHQLNVPYYCVFSGLPEDAELTVFEGMTADTFFTISQPPDSVRLYEVRVCTSAPQ